MRACLPVVRVLLASALAFLPSVAPVLALAVPAPADVDAMLVVEIEDVAGWLALHQEVLGATETARPLMVALPARTGGDRIIALERPKFTVSLVIGQPTPAVKVAIAGKIRGSDALTIVTPFQHAAMEVQARVVPNRITLVWGLSAVIGRLLELHISRA